MIKKHLAFDFGASGGRAILGVYENGKLTLTEIHRFLNEPVETNGTLHWDALRLFHELKQGLLKAQQQGHTDIETIGIDTWGVDFGLLDKNGDLLGNPVHYRDGRTDGMIEKSFAVMPKEQQYAHCGLQFMQFNTLYQLMAVKRDSPEILDIAKQALFMPDLFNYFLTGARVCEQTIASTSALCNPATHDFDTDLMRTFSLRDDLFPKTVKPGTVTGHLRESIIKELGLKYNPAVISVAQHDTASAVMAVPADGEHFAYISSGTWSLLGTETSAPCLSDEAMSLNFTNEGGYDDTTRLLKNIMGLWIIQECKRQWDRAGDVYSFGELADMASKAQPLRCLIDPDDDLFMTPNAMVDRIGAYCEKTGQYVPKTHGEVARCVYESLAMKYRFALEGLEKITGIHMPVLHVVGGGCQNKALCQYTADAIGRDVIAGPIEATAIGNIVCQMIASGELADLKQGRAMIADSFETTVYHPADTAAWDAKYVDFLKLIKH